MRFFKNIFFFTIIIYSNSLFCQESNNLELELLKESYSQNNIQLLNNFFENWEKKSKPINKKEFEQLSKVHQLTYSLFKEFYSPFGISEDDIPEDAYGLNLSKDSLEYLYLPYKYCEYIVIQNYIRVGIINNFHKAFRSDFGLYDKEDVIYDSITNFRPPILIKDKKTLFLSFNDQFLIEEFVLDSLNHLSGNDKNIMEKYNRFYELSYERLDFLRPKIGVMHGHWGGIHALTLPSISLIIFNEGLWLAKIHYRNTWCTGGEALYFRLGNKWFKLLKRQSWIE